MIPILFDTGETAFNNNGICRLRDCLSCVVVEERNGIYECEFEYPVSGANYSEIKCGRYVGVTHDETNDIQPFEIVSISRPINGVVTFHAVHLSYMQSQMVTVITSANTPQSAFNALKNATPDNPFTYETDIDSTAYMGSADGIPRSVRQFLGGVRGSILDTYGGEYEWDRWSVKLHEHRGEIKDFAIRYGVNLLDYNEELSYQGTFTSCMAYWTDNNGDSVTATATLGETGYNGRDIWVALDLSDKFESKPTQAQLQTEALAYMRRQNTNLPSQSIKVDFVRLSDMGEFDAFQGLLKCKLCDTIKVIFPMYDVSAYFKIVRTEWDVIRGAYRAMELGNLSTSLSEALGLTDSPSSGNSADYIIEEGTSGIWTYRKWDSGISECWGTSTRSNVEMGQWGSTALYYGTISADSWPSDLFTSAPNANMFARVSGGNGWLTQTVNMTESSTGTRYVIGVSNTALSAVNVVTHAYGRWK